MCSGRGNEPLRPLGFPIRKSPDQSLVTDSPGLIAGSYVLHRLLVPRHPPCALINLATTDDARVHCAVLKIRAVPVPCALRWGDTGPSRVHVPTSGRSLRTQQRARPAQPPGRLSVPCRRAAACAATQRAYSPNRASCPDRITSAPLTSDHPGTNVR